MSRSKHAARHTKYCLPSEVAGAVAILDVHQVQALFGLPAQRVWDVATYDPLLGNGCCAGPGEAKRLAGALLVARAEILGRDDALDDAKAELEKHRQVVYAARVYLALLAKFVFEKQPLSGVRKHEVDTVLAELRKLNGGAE